MVWSVAKYDLGLTTEEFHALRPREFEALCDRLLRTREHTELLFAQLTACVVNFGFCRPEKPVHAKDFMPSTWDVPEAAPSAAGPKKKRLSKQRQQEIADSFRRIMAEHGIKPTSGY